MRWPFYGPNNGLRHIFSRERSESLVNLLRFLRVAVEADQAEVGFHHPGVNGRYAHGRAQQILAQPVVDGTNCRFASAINRSVGVRQLARRGSKIHNVAAAPHYHSRHHCAGHIEQALHVCVDHLFPVVDLAGIQLVEPAAQTGIVHQHADFGPLFRQFVDRALHGGTVAHVQVHGVHGLRTAFESRRSNFSHLACAACCQQQPCAFGRKGESGGRSNSGTGSGYENDFSF